jgi:hypothetical protein
LSIPLLRAQITTYQAEERRVNGMEDQPSPDEALPLLSGKAIRA